MEDRAADDGDRRGIASHTSRAVTSERETETVFASLCTKVFVLLFPLFVINELCMTYT